MWSEITLKRNVIVHPQDMKAGGGHRRSIILKLLRDMEDEKCSRNHGYYIAPTRILQVSEGRIIETSGCVAFTVEFKCLVQKLIKNEIVELQVSKVSNLGVEASCGAYSDILLHKNEAFMKEFTYHKFSEDNLYGSHFRGVDGSEIAEGSVLCARIVGVRFVEEPTKTFRALATLNGQYLGVIDDPQLAEL